MRKRILVVKDHPDTIGLLTDMLEEEGFDVVRAQNGEQALEILTNDSPDLIFLDITLSGTDGFDLCRQIKSDPLKQHIPVMMSMLGGRSVERRREDDLTPDAFISKPFAEGDVVGQIMALLKIKTLEDRLLLVSRELRKTRRKHLKQGEDLEKAYLDTIHCLLAAAEAKDPYTSGHSYKVTEIARMIGKRMGFDSRSMTNLECASLLHDVGKIGVPLTVLNKKGRLAREEMELIKRHPDISVDILSPVTFLERIVPIIRHHHENVDGSGYPIGLVGDQIPLESRILAVADAYDAMVSDRPYRPRLENERALQVISERAGSQFDADIVGVFLQIVGEGLLEAVYGDESRGERTAKDMNRPELQLKQHS